MKKLLISILISFIPIICYAEDITKNSQIQVNNETIKKITDGNENTYISIKDGEILTITNEEDIYGIYIIYEVKSSSGLLSSNNNEIKIGQNNFLHEYIDLNKKPSKNITITYDLLYVNIFKEKGCTLRRGYKMSCLFGQLVFSIAVFDPQGGRLPLPTTSTHTTFKKYISFAPFS